MLDNRIVNYSGVRFNANQDITMRRITIIIIVAVSLVGCSPDTDQPEDSTLIIDRSEIDLAKSQGQSGGNVIPTVFWCVPAESRKYADPLSVIGEVVNITDGSKLLATGKINGLSESQEGKTVLWLSFDSPDVAEKLFDELGFIRHDIKDREGAAHYLP